MDQNAPMTIPDLGLLDFICFLIGHLVYKNATVPE